MNKRFLIVLAACAVGLGLIFWFTKDKATAPSTSSSSQATNHQLGEGKKNVTLIEYGDFQCIACGQYYPIIKQVVDKYRADITFQFRNLPLFQIHPNAFAAARAAEAAALQNKFWEMHDKLYEEQQIWAAAGSPTKYFDSYAGDLGLDTNKFKRDSASAAVNKAINADVSAFDKTGNDHATPTFFLDGKKIDTTPDVNYFSRLIDEAIAAKAKNQ